MKHLNIRLDQSYKETNTLDVLYDFLKNNKGKHSVILHLISKQGRDQKIILKKYLVDITHNCLLELRERFGSKNVWLSL